MSPARPNMVSWREAAPIRSGEGPGTRYRHFAPSDPIGTQSVHQSGRSTAGGGVIATAGRALPALGASGRRSRPVVDMTHRLVTDFPTFFPGDNAITDELLFDFDTSGFYAKQWTCAEHIGTHIDAPGHFGENAMLIDEIPADRLVAPLAVINIKQKAADDPNATVDPDDLIAYERRYGRIPRRALVAMNSGWASRVEDNDGFRGGTGFPNLNFPGFSIDATDWLVTHRDPVGIACDTMSLDPGNSPDFAVHFGFLPTNRYGIESIAGLDDVPARGTRVFVGALPWADGSGGPCRILAFTS